MVVKASEIYSVDLEDRAIEVMKVMADNAYTYVPVIDKGNFVGVFSENEILSYIAKKEYILIDENVSIGEFKDFIPINCFCQTKSVPLR